MAPSVAGDGGGAPSPGVSSRSSPLASSEHLTLPRTFTCLYYMQRGTQSTFVSQPSLTPPCLESLRQRGCPLCLRSLKRTAGEPPVSASHPHRRSPRRVELDAVPVPAVRSPRTLPGGHLGSVPSQWERPGCCQVSTAWGGARGAGHLDPPLTSTFNPARPACLCPPSGPDARYLLHPVPNQPQIIDCTRLCTPAYIYHPASRALRQLACTFSCPRSEGMEGEREGMSVPAPTPSPWLRRC